MYDDFDQSEADLAGDATVASFGVLPSFGFVFAGTVLDRPCW